jgi:DNA-nicking Smr family endonuclease
MTDEICLNCSNNPCTCGAKNYSKPISVEINVAGKDEIERLTMERDDALNKLELSADAMFKKALEVNKVSDPEIDSPEKLDAYLKGRKEQEEKNKPHEPATGKASLISHSSSVKEYETYGEMYGDLETRKKNANPEVRKEAENIEKQMWQKLQKGSYSITTEFDLGQNKRLLDDINRKLASDKPEIRKEAEEQLKAWENWQKQVKVKD